MDIDRTAQRNEFRQRRRAIPPGARIAAAERLAAHLLSLPCMPDTGAVAGYWAMDGEIALHAFQLALPPALTYCLPVLVPEQGLRFAPWRPGDALVTNRYGIPEPDVATEALLAPERMALVVLPLVAFDTHGQRLGMGGGWYDRTFGFRQRQPPPPWLVGAAFATQQTDPIEPSAWDVRLDAVCSEAGAHWFQHAPLPSEGSA